MYVSLALGREFWPKNKHPFNGLFSRTTWVSRHEKVKPFWILMKQEMMGGSGISWTMDHLYIAAYRQPCHHLITWSLQARCFSSRRSSNSVKALKANEFGQNCLDISYKCNATVLQYIARLFVMFDIVQSNLVISRFKGLARCVWYVWSLICVRHDVVV